MVEYKQKPYKMVVLYTPSVDELKAKTEEDLFNLERKKQQAVNRLNDKFNKQMAPLKKDRRTLISLAPPLALISVPCPFRVKIIVQ